MIEKRLRNLLQCYRDDHRVQWRKKLVRDGSGWPEDPPPCPCSLCNKARALIGESLSEECFKQAAAAEEGDDA
ncbi:hypothetical protein LCGC14_0839610 [marine sediment metagenome]|uniref:Uncharacterized protein n=1 Tax=marine sediment metagenome TaxID=412755 RepID=A0A0F9SKV9_9ZZZZ